MTTICGARWHDTWTCTLPPHDGDQHREYRDGILIASWLAS